MNEESYTSLADHLRLRKSDARICAIGALDELIAALGLLRAQLSGRPEAEFVAALQRDLFRIGAELATGQPHLDASALVALETETARRNAALPPLHDFILPGDSEASARAHFARTVCRRAERDLVRARESHPDRVSGLALRYLNQLSGLLFAWARSTDV